VRNAHEAQLKAAVLESSPDAQELAVQVGSRAIPWLQEQMQHDNFQIRLTALYCLVRIGGRHALDTCVRALDDDHIHIRSRAIREIYEHGNSTLVGPLLNAHAKWQDSHTRYHLALAIGKLDNTFDSVSELKRRWEWEKDSQAEEGLLVALARLEDRDAQAEFVRRLHACFKPHSNSGSGRRYLEHAEYIHGRWLLNPLLSLLDDATPLIHLRWNTYSNRPFDLRTCDLALTLAASISERTFTFPTGAGRTYSEIQRSEMQDYLWKLRNTADSRREKKSEMDQLARREIQKILRRGNLLTRKVTLAALNITKTVERFSAAHLFIKICSLDSTLVIHTLRAAFDLKTLLQSVRNFTNEQREPGQIYTVLKLAGAIAPVGTPISTAHLLVAVLLDGTNEISRYLRDRKVNVWALVDKRFPNMFPTGFFSGAAEPEMKARTWLLELIPHQACAYMVEGVIEIHSSLYPERFYRIYRDRMTQIFEHGRLVANVCIHLADCSMPQSDRVLAEYFLLKGDENSYLRTANISSCV
jgi:hypothetical protein